MRTDRLTPTNTARPSVTANVTNRRETTMTDHFKTAQRYLRNAESQFEVAKESEFVDSFALNSLHYYLQLANANTMLAQVAEQKKAFPGVGKMAESLTGQIEREAAKEGKE